MEETSAHLSTGRIPLTTPAFNTAHTIQSLSNGIKKPCRMENKLATLGFLLPRRCGFRCCRWCWRIFRQILKLDPARFPLPGIVILQISQWIKNIFGYPQILLRLAVHPFIRAASVESLFLNGGVRPHREPPIQLRKRYERHSIFDPEQFGKVAEARMVQ